MKDLRVKYLVLKEIVTLLGLFEFISLGLGAFSIGEKDWSMSVLFFCLMGASYYASTKLNYRVLEMLVRLNNGGASGRDPHIPQGKEGD